MRKLMWGAYPLSMQWTSSVKGTVMHRLKWVSLLQSCVQMQICVSSIESYCSCRRKEYLKMLGSLFHQLMRVVFCCSTKETGGSLSQLSNTPQVMLEPSTYLSSGMKSCPGQLAQQVSGSLRPVGQRASESLATTMYLKVKVQTRDSMVYSLVLSPLTMKLNSLLRRVGFCGKTLTTGVESWQRTMFSVSMVTSWALSRFMSTKAWKLGCGKAAQALRQVRLPRVKTQVDWQATVLLVASVRLAVTWATTYWSLTQRSCIHAPSGTEYLVMMTGLIWLVQSSSMMAWSWASTSRNSLTMLLEQTPSRVKPESVRYLPTMMMVCAVEMSNLMTPLWQSRMQMSPRQTSKSMMESLSWWRKERSMTLMVQGLSGLLTERISRQVLSSKCWSTCSAKQALMRQWQPSSVCSRILRWQMLEKGTYMSFLSLLRKVLEVVFTQQKQFCSPKVEFCAQSTSATPSTWNHTASQQWTEGSEVTTASLVSSGMEPLAAVVPQRSVVSLPKTLRVTRALPQALPLCAKWQFLRPDWLRAWVLSLVTFSRMKTNSCLLGMVMLRLQPEKYSFMLKLWVSWREMGKSLKEIRGELQVGTGTLLASAAKSTAARTSSALPADLDRYFTMILIKQQSSS